MGREKKTKKIKISQVDATPAPRDREIQKYLVRPVGRHRGLFSDWESIPWMSDLIKQKEQELSAKHHTHLNLQPNEIRELQRQAQEYKEGGILYREIEDGFAIGFGFRTYIDFLKNGKKRRHHDELPLFDDLEERQFAEELGDQIFQKVKSLRLYHKGQDIIEYLLSEAHHQKTNDEIIITQKALAELLDPYNTNSNIGQDVKEIIDALSWISYKIKNRDGTAVGFGAFIYDLRYDGRKKEFYISINPRFLGCTQAALKGDKDDRTKAERKELFGGGEGYYNASIRKIFLCNARNFTTTQRLLIDHILIHRGKYLKEQDKEFKIISCRIKSLIFDKDAAIKYSGNDSMKYKKFLEDVRVAIIEGIEGYAKIEPIIEQLEKLTASQVGEVVLKFYIPNNLEDIWQTALLEEVGLMTLDKQKATSTPLDASPQDDITPQLIRDTRKSKKITQKVLAEILGVSTPFICCLEKGKKTIPSTLKDKFLAWIQAH
jgi:DNA-binding transcriptional regulator YiaG